MQEGIETGTGLIAKPLHIDLARKEKAGVVRLQLKRLEIQKPIFDAEKTRGLTIDRCILNSGVGGQKDLNAGQLIRGPLDFQFGSLTEVYPNGTSGGLKKWFICEFLLTLCP